MFHDQLYHQIQSLIQMENKLIKSKEDGLKKLDNAKKQYIKIGKQLPESFDKIYNKYYNIPDDRPLINYLILVANEPAVGVYFDDTVKYDSNFSKTGMEFMKEGILEFPFPVMYFGAKNYFPDDKESQLHLFVKLFKKDNKILFFPELLDSFHNSRGMGIDLNTMEMSVFNTSLKNWPEVNEYEEYKSYFHALFHCLMTLNHPVYYSEAHEISEKINHKRERSGKVKLTKYIHVKMCREYKKSLMNADGTVRRPHWRRGHLRRLLDGRVIPIQACIVNFNGVSPEKKNYLVRNNLAAERKHA